MAFEKEVAVLRSWIAESENIVFFGGAGVSTESGIPDFRSTDGLYSQSYRYPPERIISHSFFMQNPEEFYRFYRERMLYPDAKPNRAHLALAQLEREGRMKAVVTQNIDGLHQAAGSREVIELHGSVLRNYCRRCGKAYGLADILRASEPIPRCSCGGMIKPDVVLYEESLNDAMVQRAIEWISSADMLIIGGTSLVVYPAAGLVRYYRGKRLVLINQSGTAMDGEADLMIAGKIGEILGAAVFGGEGGADTGHSCG